MESIEEVDLLVFGGIEIIAPRDLCFRHWQSWVLGLCESFLEEYRWIAIRGLPVHLWLLGLLKAIGELCGGFVKLNCSLKDKDLYQKLWIKIMKGPLSRIPSTTLVEDNGLHFVVEVWVVDDVPLLEGPRAGAFL